MATKRRRPQANKTYVEKMQNLRRSSATSPVPSRKAYKRPKAGSRERLYS